MGLSHENLQFYSSSPTLSPSIPPFSALDRFLTGQTRLLQIQSQTYTINNQMESDPNSWLLPYLQGDDQNYSTLYYDNNFHECNNSQVRPENGASSGAKTSMRSRRGSCSTLVKRKWSDEEDRALVKLVKDYGMKIKWACIAQKLDRRTAKQCRERWQNHLRPDIKKDSWSEEEEKAFIEAHKKLGNRWSEIARRIPGRTENAVKNHWNAAKRRRLNSNKKKKGKYLPKPSSFLQDYIMSNNLYSPIDAKKTARAKILATPPLEVEYESSSSTLINDPASGEELVFMFNLFNGTNHQPLGLLPPPSTYDHCLSDYL